MTNPDKLDRQLDYELMVTERREDVIDRMCLDRGLDFPDKTVIRFVAAMTEDEIALYHRERVVSRESGLRNDPEVERSQMILGGLVDWHVSPKPNTGWK